MLLQVLAVLCVFSCSVSASIKKCYKLPTKKAYSPFPPEYNSEKHPVSHAQQESTGSRKPPPAKARPADQTPSKPQPEPSKKFGPTSKDNNMYLAEVSLKRGDLPTCQGSEHLDAGYPLNTDKLNAIFDYVGLPSIREAVRILEDKGAYNAGQNGAQKVQGAYLAWSTAAKLKILSPAGKTQDENELTFGALKRAGFRKDVAKVKSILAKRPSTHTFEITDQLMTYLWGSNEHHCLHAILFGNECIKNTIHITSLNDHDSADNDSHPAEEDGLRGGYDDKGRAPQWGIWEQSSKFLGELGLN